MHSNSRHLLLLHNLELREQVNYISETVFNYNSAVSLITFLYKIFMLEYNGFGIAVKNYVRQQEQLVKSLYSQ